MYVGNLNFFIILNIAICVLSVYGYPVPHIAVIYNDGLVFDISLEDDISPSKNLLIKLPDERNKKDDRGKRYAYQDQLGHSTSFLQQYLDLSLSYNKNLDFTQ